MLENDALSDFLQLGRDLEAAEARLAAIAKLMEAEDAKSIRSELGQAVYALARGGDSPKTAEESEAEAMTLSIPDAQRRQLESRLQVRVNEHGHEHLWQLVVISDSQAEWQPVEIVPLDAPTIVDIVGVDNPPIRQGS